MMATNTYTEDCDPHLGFDCIFGCAVKRLDTEMLFDPFKKQFHFPAMTVEVGHRLGRDDNSVGGKVIGLVVLCVMMLDEAQRLRVVGFGLPSVQHDWLVASVSCGLVHAA